jgi:DNA/RNA-binding domain of Phe-tRNA-synthetase-like protein
VAGGAAQEGWVDPDLAAELPGLAVLWTEVAARAGRTPRAVRDRMRSLADRITGERVVGMRQDEVPWAYRVLWRRLGVDPDIDRTPVERLMLERLRAGGLPSHGMPVDAVTVATIETGVPVCVFDAEAIQGELGLRPATAGERLGGEEGPALRAGEIVYADRKRPVATLSGEVAGACATTERTARMTVAVLAAPSVSQMALDEALWTASGLLEAAGTLDTSS